MGIHITIKNKRGEEHPDWDYIRYRNDRDFWSLITRLEQPKGFIVDDEYGDVIGFRPGDIPALRRQIIRKQYSNEKRYLQFCDIMEEDEQWFVRTIY